MIKIVTALSSIILFLIFICILWLNQLEVQVYFLILVIGINCWKYKAYTVWKEVKYLMPFVLVMMTVYSILGLLKVKFDNNLANNNHLFRSWFEYGFVRSILFVSSVLFLQFVLSFITLKEILSLPIRIKYLKALILGRSLFTYATSQIQRIDFYINLIPYYQQNRLKTQDKFKQKIVLIVALVDVVLKESELLGELIDNRIKHCYKE